MEASARRICGVSVMIAETTTRTAGDRIAGEPVDRGSVRESRILIGYARCSTDRQDLSAQRRALRELGVSDDPTG